MWVICVCLVCSVHGWCVCSVHGVCVCVCVVCMGGVCVCMCSVHGWCVCVCVVCMDGVCMCSKLSHTLTLEAW